MDLEKVGKAYRRFIENQDTHSGFYIYPQYESDLNILLDFISIMLMRFVEEK